MFNSTDKNFKTNWTEDYGVFPHFLGLTSRLINLHAFICMQDEVIHKGRPHKAMNWRKVTWKRINNFRFGSTAKVNYVILITDSETFKLKHFPKFPAYFMLKRLKSSSALPQKLEKSSKNLQKVSKIHQENRYRWNGYLKTPVDNRDTNHDGCNLQLIMTTGYSCCIIYAIISLCHHIIWFMLQKN